MYVFRTNAGLRKYLQTQGSKRIGFTPTMGALHEGHLALHHRSKEECDLTVVSIFVNPTQFNDPADLEKYPRTLDIDLKLLLKAECDVAYAPSVEEVYPRNMTFDPIDLQGLDETMEGMFRPGHFAGVAQVVKRLLDIVQPQALYMGQKDFQQVAVIRHMIKALHIPVDLVMCPTLREADGLAMSSRNVRLDPELRKRATIIYQTLMYCREKVQNSPVDELQMTCLQKLAIDGFRPEYFDIVDGNTLQPATNETRYKVACCAVWAGDVRLIDNIILTF